LALEVISGKFTAAGMKSMEEDEKTEAEKTGNAVCNVLLPRSTKV